MSRKDTTIKLFLIEGIERENNMEIIKSIITNILTAFYQPFGFSLILSVFILFFYMYAYHPMNTGKGLKAACYAWLHNFRTSVFFRKLFFLVFYTALILFRTLLNRDLWMNPLSNVMDGWWIWVINPDGTKVLSTECFENMILMLPFTFLLMWTMKEKLIGKDRDRDTENNICFSSVVWASTKIAFLFSFIIEILQLLLRLGTFQLSDLCYNTLGGAVGGMLYWICWRMRKLSSAFCKP